MNTRLTKIETVEQYLLRHAVMDGQGNIDGLFVPLSVAHIAAENAMVGKLEMRCPTWRSPPPDKGE
jgi:hypothetical protein